jgi:hypothetical protein
MAVESDSARLIETVGKVGSRQSRGAWVYGRLWRSQKTTAQGPRRTPARARPLPGGGQYFTRNFGWGRFQLMVSPRPSTPCSSRRAPLAGSKGWASLFGNRAVAPLCAVLLDGLGQADLATMCALHEGYNSASRPMIIISMVDSRRVEDKIGSKAERDQARRGGNERAQAPVCRAA